MFEQIMGYISATYMSYVKLLGNVWAMGPVHLKSYWLAQNITGKHLKIKN